MLLFWIVAALVSVGAALLMLTRAAAAERRLGPADPTLEVYRRQLAEIDDLAERGLLRSEERDAAHAEAGRRMLGEARQRGPERALAGPTPAARRAVLAVAILAPCLALGIYLAAGRPGLPDQPYKARLKGWVQTAQTDPSQLDPPRLVAVLDASVAKRPNDPKGLSLLGEYQARSGDANAAIRSLRKAAALAPTDAEVWTSLGQALVEAAPDSVSDEAVRAFHQANALDPTAPVPRYFLARADIAAGRPAAGLTTWRSLADAMPAGEPGRVALEADIAETTRTGRLPAAQAAPRPAAEGGQQAAFIQSMVDRLAARLKAQPDDPAGWARLIRSYGVLGRNDLRQAAIGAARRQFKDRPDALKTALQGEAPTR